MTNTRILFALTSVYCLQKTELIPEDQKEIRLIGSLEFMGYDNDDIEDLVDLFNEGDAEELLRELGCDDEFLEGAMLGYEEKLTKF